MSKINSTFSPIQTSMLDLIGNTPMVQVKNLPTGKCSLYLKLENQNPGGSIKDRMALSMVLAAERDGKLKPGGTIVEATAGNTGLSLAMVAQQKGYPLILVIPDKMSQEKIFHLRAMGVEVVLVPSNVTHTHPDYYQNKARSLAASIPGAFYIDQFNNPANPDAHYRTTAPEIWEQMEHNVDAIVCGSGSAGTIIGIGRYFRETAPKTEIILADPKGSVLAPFIQHGAKIEAGSWLVEGIGKEFIPEDMDLSLISQAMIVDDAESIQTARDLLHLESILGGSSTGTQVAAALRYCQAQTTPKRVVTFVCDSGNKYLSKIYNPYWLQDQGLSETEEHHDLRDLIARPYLQGKTVSVTGADTLQQVYAKMKLYDVSQVPVMDADHIIGLMSETNLLLAVTGNPKGFGIRVGAVMSDKPVTLQVNQPITDLLPIFERNGIACINDKDQFLGLITPIDFLNYLRKRTG